MLAVVQISQCNLLVSREGALGLFAGEYVSVPHPDDA